MSASRVADEAQRLTELRYREGLATGRELLDSVEDAARAREAVGAARAARHAARLITRVALGLEPLATTPAGDPAS